MLPTIREDWRRNRHSIKSLIVVMSFRLSSTLAGHDNFLVRCLGLPVRISYKLVVELVMGVELPDRVKAGPGLAVFHGVGLVVNSQTRIGRNVTLRQNTTIGVKSEGEGAPIICDDVSIGANAVILGDITIGARTLIGAGAVVTQDCPEDSIAYGAKARISAPAHISRGAADA